MRARLSLFLMLLLCARDGAAYHWFNSPGTGPASGTFVFHRWITTPVAYIVDNEPLPAGITIAGDVTPAFSAWQNVATSSITFTQSPNTTGIANFTWSASAASGAVSPTWGITTDGRNEVAFVHDGDGSFAPGTYGLGVSTTDLDTGEITDFTLYINLDASASTDPTLLGVMVHEAGHVIGVGHSSVGSANFTFFPLPHAERPTMYAWAQAGDNDRLETLEPDDILAISRMYPDPSFNAGQRLSGRVLKGTDGTFARGVYVRVVNTADTNDQIAALSDFFGTSTGEWAIPGLAAGTYNVLIDPISGIIFPGKIEDDGVGSAAHTYAGFPREHFDAAESNHDTATALLGMPVLANWDTHNVVLVTNQGTLSDPAITPWGASQAPPVAPWWQTSDIWVDNDADGTVNEANEPERDRSNNTLFARIRNRGNQNANNYRVRFEFKPYTTNASHPAILIGSVNETSTPLAPGATRNYQINWDLSNAVLSALPAPFDTADHFCVQVTIEDTAGSPLTNDSNPSNNFAQNNFSNVPLCSTCFQSASFVVYNHLDRPARASLEWIARRQSGAVRFEGVSDPSNIPLRPRESRIVRAHLTSESRTGDVFDVTQRLDGSVVGGVTMALSPARRPGDGNSGGGPDSGTDAAFRRGWLLGVQSGTNWPLGSFKRRYEPSALFAVQLERPIAPQWRVAWQGGYHEFDEKFEGANLGITNVSLLARFVGSAPSVRPFALFGPGAYRVAGTWHAGMQIGLGLEVPVSPNAALTTGAALHRVNGDDRKPQWIDGYIGFLFRIP